MYFLSLVGISYRFYIWNLWVKYPFNTYMGVYRTYFHLCPLSRKWDGQRKCGMHVSTFLNDLICQRLMPLVKITACPFTVHIEHTYHIMRLIISFIPYGHGLRWVIGRPSQADLSNYNNYAIFITRGIYGKWCHGLSILVSLHLERQELYALHPTQSQNGLRSQHSDLKTKGNSYSTKKLNCCSNRKKYNAI